MQGTQPLIIKKADDYTQISEIKNEIDDDHDKYITSPEFSRLRQKMQTRTSKFSKQN